MSISMATECYHYLINAYLLNMLRIGNESQLFQELEGLAKKYDDYNATQASKAANCAICLMSLECLV